MPLGLLPLGTGGADDRLPIVGFVWLGTGGGSASAGVIAACISAGANCLGDVREGEAQRCDYVPFYQSKILPSLPRRQLLQQQS